MFSNDFENDKIDFSHFVSSKFVDFKKSQWMKDLLDNK